MYLSVSRYRSAGFGIDVSDTEDAELRAVLARASSLVDVYCGIPMQPSRHDFRGGTITGEQHEWRLATDLVLGARRVYLNHRPIGEITRFLVKFTNTFQVEIDPINIYVNKQSGWAEVVSLAAVISGVYPIGVNFGLYTPVAEIDYTYGYSNTAVGDTLYVTDGNTFQSTYSAWSEDPDPVVYVDGAEADPTDYTIDYAEGEVVFDDPLPASSKVTANYTYTLPGDISEAAGIIAAHLLGERDLSAKGMAGLSSIKVAEVALARSNRGVLGLAQTDVIPVAAASLLDPFRYRSVG